MTPGRRRAPSAAVNKPFNPITLNDGKTCRTKSRLSGPAAVAVQRPFLPSVAARRPADGRGKALRHATRGVLWTPADRTAESGDARIVLKAKVRYRTSFLQKCLPCRACRYACTYVYQVRHSVNNALNTGQSLFLTESDIHRPA